MWLAIAAALITGGVVWAATRKPSGGATVAAAPVKRDAAWQPVDAEDLEQLRQELEAGFLKKAGVKWTALGNVFVDDDRVLIDVSMLTPLDARKVQSLLPASVKLKGRPLVFKLPVVPAAKVGGDLDIGGINDGLDEVGGGDWGQP